MSGKGKAPKVFLFNFASGSPTWGYVMADSDNRGVYDPRFSTIDAAWQGTWPDPGVAPGKAPNLTFGERLGQDVLDLLPKTIRVGGHTPETRGKHPRDINIITDGEFGGNPIVSQRLKDVIEDLEPGVHQFAPVGFVNRVTDAPIWTDVPWYFLNVTTWIAPDLLFAWEAMGDAMEFKQFPAYGCAPETVLMSFPLWFRYKKYLLNHRAVIHEIGSHHLWVSNRYYKSIDCQIRIDSAAFCSETFRRACKAAGLKGGHFIKLAMAEERDGTAQASSPRGDVGGAAR